MKKIVTILICLFLIYNCEDVIEVDVPEEEPRLIVNGLVRVDKSKEFVGVQIKLTSSDDFFGELNPTQAEDVSILYGIEDEQGFIAEPSFSNLVERVPGTGIYEPLLESSQENRIRTADVNPNVSFQLFITYQDRIYSARTKYVPTAPLDNLEQGTDYLFDEDETEIKITYTDDPQRDDFYVFDLDLGNFLVSEDNFYQGEQFTFSFFYDQDVKAGDQLEISILGADRQFFNYMNLLLQQTEENFNIFDTPSATIRGNVFDVTDIDNTEQFNNVEATDNFPLGYFAVVQEFKETITIEEN